MTRTRINKMMAGFLSIIMIMAFLANMPNYIVRAQNRTENFNKNYTYSSDPGQYMVNIALAQQGKTGSQLGYTVDWCAYFVSDCAELANQSQAIPRHGRADYLDKNILDAGGEKVKFSDARPGDIAFYDGNYNNSPDHVEIVYSVSGSTVTTLGGNTGNKDCLKSIVSKPRSYGNILYIIRPNYSGSSTSKPSWAWISATDDRTSFDVGEEIHFSMSADESNGAITHYLIGINKGDERIITEECNGDYYISFDEPGNYSVYVSAYNSAGWADSNTINFEVITPRPSWAWISATDDRTSFDVGEEIHFSMSADESNGAITHYLIGINKGDERIITEDCNGDYYVSFDEPGNYSVYVSAYNSAGWADSNTINFTVSKPNLEAPNLNVDVNGQEVTFSWNFVDNATGYDLRIYNSDGTSYADYWDFRSDENSLTITMPAKTEFSAAVCSKNSNYEECFSYCQPVNFKTRVNKYIISFVCDGDIISSKEVTYNSTYGTLPTPTKIGCTFAGWYTEKDSGTKVTADTIVNITSDQTLYAHWEKVYIKGDVNADGKLTVDDAALLQKYLLNETTLTETQYILADLNTDGAVNGIDLALLRQKLTA